ncbi:aspartate kinase [Clostridiaceae bacterium M8S5]|nr:aspartate kinase [Clostridiaceae bacterium M8S5]
MKIIVQKFGGSSLVDKEKREHAIDRILQRYKEGYSIVVVVSAMGRRGDNYSTDSLLDLINEDSKDLRSKDLLMSCGEVISAVVLTNMLNESKLPATAFTGGQAGIITDACYSKAEVLYINTNRIVKCLQKGRIAVVTGFQGMTKDREITTLGRGGSDTSAVLLGEALGSELVEIYTDVDGVLTADPKIVSDARVIRTICYNELYQLAEDGAKVIHPKAVEIARNKNMRILIRNTVKDDVGTLVTNSLNSDYYSDDKKIISALTHKSNKVQITIFTEQSKDMVNKLMKEIAQEGISIDLINFFIEKIIFTVCLDDLEKLKKILKNKDYKYNIVSNLSKLSIIGHRMCGEPGVMQRIAKALYGEKIDILQTSDSHTTIWCLIDTKYVNKAINALHKEFELNIDD